VGAHPVEGALVEAQGHRLVLAQRLLGHGRGHERVAVPVASDPAPEAQEVGDAEGPLRVDRRQAVAEAPLDHRREIEESALEEKEAVAHLVEDGGAVAAGLLRLPERDHLLAQLLEGGLGLLGSEGPEVQDVEGVRDPSQLGEDGPALGLGGVRREDGHDQEAIHQPLHLLRGNSLLAQGKEGGRDRLVHRPPLRARLASPPPHHPDPLLLLRQVHELEIRGECLDDAPRFGERQRLDPLEEAGSRGPVSRAVGLGEPPHLFDQVEEPPPLLLHHRVAEQIPQEVDLLAEEIALGGQLQSPGRYSRTRWARISDSSSHTGFSSPRANSGDWSA